MAKKSNAPRVIVLILVLGVAALLVYFWMRHRQSSTDTASSTAPISENAPFAVPLDHVVPSNEGRTIALSGKLDVRTCTEAAAVAFRHQLLDDAD